MRKLILTTMAIALFLYIPLHSQNTADKSGKETKAEKSEKTEAPSKYTIYSEEALEDFETTQYTAKNLEFVVTRYQEAGISVRDENPAPSGGSKKYLGIKFLGKSWAGGGDVLIIRPAKEIAVEKYIKQISIWVNGRKMSGELSIMVRDAREVNHRLVFGRLNFLGWRKLTVQLDKMVKQTDDFLNQKKVVRIVHLQYRPLNITDLPMWHYFYLDDLTATVRDKYTDRQSDDW